MISLFFMYALSTFPLSKIALAYTSPLFFIAVRMTIAGMLLLVYTILAGLHTQLQKKYFWLYGQAILFASFFPYILRYYGLQHTSLTGAYLLLQTAPLITYACSSFFYKTPINNQKILLLSAAFFTSLLMMGSAFWHNGNAMINLGLNVTSWALLASVICFIYGWLIIQKLMTTDNHHPIAINTVTMLGSGLLACIATIYTNNSTAIIQLQPFLIALIPIILIGNLGTHTLYAFLARRYSLTLIALGGHLSPLFTALYQKAFSNTPIALHYWPAGCLLLAILFIFYRLETTEQFECQTTKITT